MKVNDRLQYGQANGSGDRRFVVYHDKDRKLFQVRRRPYSLATGMLADTNHIFQHRFISTAIASALANRGAAVAEKVSDDFGVPFGTATALKKQLETIFGNYLNTFPV
jgi:hypothetical protein